MSKIENTWRLAPVAAAQHELAEVRAALGFLPQGYSAMAGLERLADLLAAAEPSPTSPAVSTEQDAPITVTVDHDPRGVSVGVWQGSHCIYSGAHPLPAAAGLSTVEKQRPARDWELTCHECDGSGHVYVKHQVAERKTDTQEFKEECECCEGRGFVFAFQDIPGIEEYVKACRTASSAPGVSTVEDAGAHKVVIDFDQVGSAGPFYVFDGRVTIPAVTVMDLVRMAAPAAGDARTAAARDVLAERQRQISVEGRTPAHDDQYTAGDMASAAVCYAAQGRHHYPEPGRPGPSWPWAAEWWKPSTYRRNLEKAGALILAEIERLDRAAQRAGDA